MFAETTFEADESFAIVLSGATGGVIRDATAVGTIRNDDAQPLLGIAAGSVRASAAKAPRGVVAGDRLAHVGYINATGIDLGKVQVKGDLGQIDAGDDLTPNPGLLNLSAQSIGRSGLFTQLPGGSLQSDIVGAVKSLKLEARAHRRSRQRCRRLSCRLQR